MAGTSGKGLLPRQVAYYTALLWLCRLHPHFARWPRAMAQMYSNAPEKVQKQVAAVMVYGFGILGRQHAAFLPISYGEADFRALARAIGRRPSPIGFRRTEDGDVEISIDVSATQLVRELAA